MPRWLPHFMLILAVMGTISSCGGDETPELHGERTSSTSGQNEHGQIQWFTFDDALAKARTDNRPIFVEFYADWCVACKTFQRETLQNENVAEILAKNYVAVRVNAEESEDRVRYRDKYFSSVALAEAFGIGAFPTLVFLDSGGEVVTKIPGFVPPNQFSAILNYIHQKCYATKISLHEFVKQGKCN